MSELYLTSFVQRWHTHPRLAREGQNLGHHQWGCAALIAQLHPEPTTALVLAALFHDVGEAVTGDMPYTAKQRYGDILGPMEKESQERLTGYRFHLTDEDNRWIKFVDRLESYLFVKLKSPSVLAEPEWIKCRDWITKEAWSLEVGEIVGGWV